MLDSLVTEGVSGDGRLHGVGARKRQEDEPDPEREDGFRHEGGFDVVRDAAVDVAHDARVVASKRPRLQIRLA